MNSSVAWLLAWLQEVYQYGTVRDNNAAYSYLTRLTSTWTRDVWYASSRHMISTVDVARSLFATINVRN